MPTNWTEQTPILWLNQQAQATAEAPDETPAPEATAEGIAPVVINIEAPSAPQAVDGGGAYEEAFTGLIDLLIATFDTFGKYIVIGMGIWKFAPTLIALLEFATKFTPSKKDDAKVAEIKAILIGLGVIPNETQAQATLRQKYGTIDPNDTTLRG